MAKDVVEALDAKILEAEKELERLKRIAAQIPQIEVDLQSLRRTRSMFGPKKPSNDVGSTTKTVAITTREPKLQPHSIGGLAVEILKESGRPMHVDDILPRLRSKGKSASRASLVATLIRYMQDGVLTKTAANTFTLPEKRG